MRTGKILVKKFTHVAFSSQHGVLVLSLLYIRSYDWVKGNVDNLVLLVIDIVPQERRTLVNTNRGKQR